jgi:hypothetical protein
MAIGRIREKTKDFAPRGETAAAWRTFDRATGFWRAVPLPKTAFSRLPLVRAADP